MTSPIDPETTCLVGLLRSAGESFKNVEVGMILLSLVFFEKVAKRAREYGDDSKNEAAQEALKESHISNVDKKEADAQAR